MSQVSILGSTTFLCLTPFSQGVWMDRQTVKSHTVSTLLRICMGDGSFQDALWGCRAQCSLHHKKETKQRFKIFLSFLHIVHHCTVHHTVVPSSATILCCCQVGGEEVTGGIHLKNVGLTNTVLWQPSVSAGNLNLYTIRRELHFLHSSSITWHYHIQEV
jgi:hypothetical protein